MAPLTRGRTGRCRRTLAPSGLSPALLVHDELGQVRGPGLRCTSTETATAAQAETAVGDQYTSAD
jgi:hypothetical protein